MKTINPSLLLDVKLGEPGDIDGLPVRELQMDW
jgi:hypothetical protein